jgi:hypothetical protein
MVAPHVAASDVIQVRGVCGLGADRGPYGYCVPNGVVVVAPPAYYVAPPVAVMPPVVCPLRLLLRPLRPLRTHSVTD